MRSHILTRRTLIVAIALWLVASASSLAADREKATTADNRRWGLEIGACMDFLQDGLPQFCHNKPGGGVYFETRCRIGQTPIDVGLYASLNTAPRRYSATVEKELLDENAAPIGRVIFTREGQIPFGSGNVMATINCNLSLGRRCEAFVGAGVGISKYADNGHWNSDPGYRGSGVSLSLMPRAGILLFDHLRLTTGYKFQERANRHAFVSIGLVGFIGKR